MEVKGRVAVPGRSGCGGSGSAHSSAMLRAQKILKWGKKYHSLTANPTALKQHHFKGAHMMVRVVPAQVQLAAVGSP